MDHWRLPAGVPPEAYTMKHYWDHRTKKFDKQGVTEKTTLFRGLSFYINGRTLGVTNYEALGKIIQSNGGLVTPNLSSRVTHVIASNLCRSKMSKHLAKMGAEQRRHISVVKPEWVLDSVQQQRRLSEFKYRAVSDKSKGTRTGIDSFLSRGSSGVHRPGSGTRANTGLKGSSGGVSKGTGVKRVSVSSDPLAPSVSVAHRASAAQGGGAESKSLCTTVPTNHVVPDSSCIPDMGDACGSEKVSTQVLSSQETETDVSEGS
ncbi:hypothetical protein KIPB_002321 [Kipferlia bialata]|uniref:BRCT domain-containing protein n=1 Tax=Kipferlia bialata TaxID=797122 RepID=A0A9K3GFW5_9EUKA|nr:hypothetical protein KIPB_002321 [Kipferlia bialata]|eukprot:g2321.t1